MENSLLRVSLEKLAVKIISTVYKSRLGHLLGPQEVGVRWGVEMVALCFLKELGDGSGKGGGPRGKP